MTDFRETNRQSWNAATQAHNKHKADQAGFLRRGGTTLFPDEIGLLGDLTGQRVLHLQCNSGQDTLGLAALGATVTGVDLSDEAVAFARRLSEESGIAAAFEEGEICEWLESAGAAGRRFDVAYATYGAMGWIEDLGRWMRGVHGVLEPGGRLISIEFHPLVWSFDAEFKLIEPYFIDGPIEEDGVSDYVADAGDGLAPMGLSDAGGSDEPFENPHGCASWQWTVGDVVTLAAEAGLVIERLEELPYANGAKVQPGLVDIGDRRFGFPEGVPAMPLMVSLVARRP